MFEYDQEIIDSLLTEDSDFKRLYSKYGDLKQKVQDANDGIHPLDDVALESMKKEKLMLKDRMAAKIHAYRQTRVC